MIEVRFYSVDDIEHFVNNMNSIECDINLYDGRKMLDAKSMVGLMNLDFLHKNFKIECVSDDPEILNKFSERVKDYVSS